MIDYTFDIANEYLRKLKLSHKEILELDEIYRKEDSERQERKARSDQGLPEIVPLPIQTYEEYLRKQPKIIRKVYNMCIKYCKDRRLCYSNDSYYQVVFVIALHNMIEQSISASFSSYEIARRIIEQNRKMIDQGTFEKYEGTIYPKVLMDELEAKILELKKDFPWHKNEECGLFDTFMVAYHYGQEIED